MDQKVKKILFIFCICLIILLVIGIIIATIIHLLSVSKNDYAIIFDAGSSGTRMYIYEWKSNSKPKDDLIIKQIAVCYPDDNGIDKIKNRTELEVKFSKCIQKAHELIPQDRKNRTKINLAATAGMRLLSYNSPNITNDIFKNIRDYFSQSGFLFSNESQVKIITGRDEALNAWISANYFENNFDKLKDTKGIIDLGGASTQIVFVPRSSSSHGSKTIRLFDINYSTYSQSFLCYGMNEATLMYKTHLIQESLASSLNLSIYADCFPKAAKSNLTRNQFIKSPCVNGDIYEEDIGVVDHIFQSSNYYTLNGESNYEKCSNDIKKLFNKKQKCKIDSNQNDPDACTFENIFIADVKSSKFLALSSFWYAIDNMNRFWNKTFDYNINSFREATKQLCSLNLTQLIEINNANKANIETNRLDKMCFSNVYVMELLTKYGFESIENIQVVEKIKGYTVGWTLGYLINELNSGYYLPDEPNESRLSLPLYLIALGSFVSLILLFIAFLFFLMFKSSNQ